MKLYSIDFYTSQGVISFIVKGVGQDFEHDAIAAFEGGNVVTLTTAEDSTVVINPIHAAAIEIKEYSDTPHA